MKHVAALTLAAASIFGAGSPAYAACDIVLPESGARNYWENLIWNTQRHTQILSLGVWVHDGGVRGFSWGKYTAEYETVSDARGCDPWPNS
jgi:hypothetical protein